MGLPLAILLASIMTFGNLGESYELFAIKSGGISLYRIMSPLIVLIFFISIGAFYFSNNLLPYTNLKMRTLLHDVQQQNPEVSIQEGIFTDNIEGLSIRVEEKDKKTGELKNILVYDHRDRSKPAAIIIAESGSMKITSDKLYMILKLQNGEMYDEIKENKSRRERRYPFQRNQFKEQTIYISLDGFGLKRSDEALFKDNYQMLSLSQLNTAIDSLAVDVIKRKNIIGTNILKYSLFKGMRDYVPKSNLVEHTKTIITTNKETGEKQEIVKSLNNQDKDSEEEEEERKRKEQELLFSTNFPFPHFDTISKENITTIDIDSLYQNLSSIDKNAVVNIAQSNARNGQVYTYYSKKDMDGARRWITRHEIEWHKKFVLSLSCLILFFIGAPLGAIIRKGGIGMPTVIAILFFIIYFIISMFSEKMVREAILPAEIGMWISSAILLPIGILLTIKAANDSMNVRTESYQRFIQKIKLKRKRKRKHK